MENFQKIKIITQCDVVLHQGNKTNVKIIADESATDWVEYEVKNGELIVFTRPEYYGFLLMNGNCPKVHITTNFLIGIEVLDKASVSSENMLQVHRLGIVVKAGNINLNIHAGYVEPVILKKAYVKLTGLCLTSNAMIHNQGTFDASELEVFEGSLYISSGSTAKVFTSELLELRMFGRSSLEICGNPKINLQHLDEDCSIKIIESELIENYEAS